MTFLFRSEPIDYEYIFNHKKDTILFLHGWGGDKNSFVFLNKYLIQKFNIISITMPTNLDTNLVFDLNDYSTLIELIIKTNNIENVIIICHSFGFRVACLLKTKIKIKKIIVTGGAGIKNNNFFRKIRLNSIKILSKSSNFRQILKNNSNLDYISLSTINKKTFQNIINFDLKFMLNFDCPMLLFWGKFDSATPLRNAKIIARNNKCKLVISNSDHFAYLLDRDYFSFVLGEFLNDC